MANRGAPVREGAAQDRHVERESVERDEHTGPIRRLREELQVSPAEQEPRTMVVEHSDGGDPFEARVVVAGLDVDVEHAVAERRQHSPVLTRGKKRRQPIGVPATERGGGLDRRAQQLTRTSRQPGVLCLPEIIPISNSRPPQPPFAGGADAGRELKRRLEQDLNILSGTSFIGIAGSHFLSWAAK